MADRAIYLLSGTLPIEAMIHHRVLAFFGNISRLSESSIEKRLAERQLAVKSLDRQSQLVCRGEEVMHQIWATRLYRNFGKTTIETLMEGYI